MASTFWGEQLVNNNKKMKIISYVVTAIIVAVLLDLIVVFWSMAAIAQGKNVQHIPFWDTQIRLISNLNPQ